MTKIYLIAGEASGDLLGARLCRALRKYCDDQIVFKGIAGPAMQASGMETLFPMQELSVVGLLEVLPKILHLKRRIQETVDDIIAWQPNIIVTIDSPSFTLRVIKRLRQLQPDCMINCRFVHYVAPTVWAWKPKRAQKMAKLFDRLLVLLPFEPAYFLSEGLDTRFVGHSVLELAQDADQSQDYLSENAKNFMSLLYLPGSREKEVTRLLPIFLQVLDLLKKNDIQFTVSLMTLPHLTPLIQTLIKNSPHQIKIYDQVEVKWDLYQKSDIALAASGTVSLELALAKTPHIVVYKLNQLTYLLLKRLIKVPYVSLINLLLRRTALPELLQDQCRPDKIFEEIQRIWQCSDQYQSQLDSMSEAIAQLHPKSDLPPSHEAAKAVLDIPLSLS